MAKQGMKRPDRTHTKEKNAQTPVPEIQGKAKSGKEKAKPVIAGVDGGTQRVYHSKPHLENNEDIPLMDAIDTDLAMDNIENDLPKADLQDL